jgi:hypothetical protein
MCVGDVLRETLAKLGLNVGNMKFSTRMQTERIRIINYINNFTLCISVHHWQ